MAAATTTPIPDQPAGSTGWSAGCANSSTSPPAAEASTMVAAEKIHRCGSTCWPVRHHECV
jgi:hypothetical protein